MVKGVAAEAHSWHSGWVTAVSPSCLPQVKFSDMVGQEAHSPLKCKKGLLCREAFYSSWSFTYLRWISVCYWYPSNLKAFSSSWPVTKTGISAV